MMMNQFHRRGDHDHVALGYSRSSRFTSTTLFALIGVVALLMVVGMPERVTNVVHSLLIPLSSLKASVTDAVPAMQSYEELQAAYEVLQQEHKQAQFEIMIAELLREENKSLKKALGRHDEGSALLARIVRRPPDTLYDTLVIDVGEVHGVSVGDIVVSNHVVLGVVRKVLDTTATVVLYSAPHEQTRVMIGVGTSTKPALVRGLGAGNYIAQIPRGVSIEPDDLVRLPTMSNYILSRVDRVISQPADSFQTVLFQIPINLSEQEQVLVLIGHDSYEE